MSFASKIILWTVLEGEWGVDGSHIVFDEWHLRSRQLKLAMIEDLAVDIDLKYVDESDSLDR